MASNYCRAKVRKVFGPKSLVPAFAILLVIAAAGIAFAQAKTATTAKKPATTKALPAGTTGNNPAAVTPAPATPPPEETTASKAIRQMAFLSGKWAGHVDAFPFQMDIAIQGAMADPGPGIVFKINATPTSSAKMGIEGDYKSSVNYSTKHAALRAVIVDAAGRGVEMLGNKVPNQPEWQFESTPDGSPFPFKVRLIPINTDQIVVNYTTGGRLPLKYEVTFNRVDS